MTKKEKALNVISLILACSGVTVLAFAGAMWLLGSIGTTGVDKVIAYPFAGAMVFFLMKEIVKELL